MLKRYLFAFLFVAFGFSATAQEDSTDLSLYFEEAELLTAMDTMLYGGGDYGELHLDFTISDTVSFNTVCVELKELTTSNLVFKHVYTLTELETEGLISAWLVAIPFGNLIEEESYEVSIIIGDYAGALGSTISKTLIP